MSDTSHRDDDDHEERDERDGIGHDRNDAAHAVFAGLAPRQLYSIESNTRSERTDNNGTRHRMAKSLYATVPIVLVGSMAVAMNMPGTMESAQVKRPIQPKAENSEAVLATSPRSAGAANAATASAAAVSPRSTLATTQAPRVYRVIAGDTVSDLAARFGLSTPSVLALNGLSWSSLIFPGQQLTLSTAGDQADAAAEDQRTAESSTTGDGVYTIVAGDTISAIAERFGVSTISVLMANGLGWSSIIYPGQTIVIPGAKIPTDSPALDQREPSVVIRDEAASETSLKGGLPSGQTPSASMPAEDAPAPRAESPGPGLEPAPPTESAPPPAPPAPRASPGTTRSTPSR